MRARFLLPLLLLAGCAPEPSRFAPGQVWTLAARDSAVRSEATVLRVERDPDLGPVVHVALRDTRWTGEVPPEGRYLAFTEEAFAASVVAQVGRAPVDASAEPPWEWDGSVFSSRVDPTVATEERLKEIRARREAASP